MERKNKPSAIPTSASLPQPQVDVTDNVVVASLPNSSDTVTINLYGATVTSWTSSPSGKEQIFLSTAAKLDGSKPIRGGIPLVFPVFGPPPPDHTTGKLPQHGFARNNYWEFLGKSSSESLGRKADDSVKLDFGLSSGMLDPETRKKWPYEFGLVYSVTLSKGSLEVGMHVQNKGDESWEFQCLFHTYLTVKVRFQIPSHKSKNCHSSMLLYLQTTRGTDTIMRFQTVTNVFQDISSTTLAGLQSSPYIDKVRGAKSFTESSSSAGIKVTSETDRVYTPPPTESGALVPLTLLESGQPKLIISRDGLPDVTVWNQWEEKSAKMADFAPKDAWKRYICVEPGAVNKWVKLEGGDAWEGSVIMECKL